MELVEELVRPDGHQHLFTLLKRFKFELLDATVLAITYLRSAHMLEDGEACLDARRPCIDLSPVDPPEQCSELLPVVQRQRLGIDQLQLELLRQILDGTLLDLEVVRSL